MYVQRMTARPRLKLDSANSAYEHEADQVATSVESGQSSNLAVHSTQSTGSIVEPSLAASLLRQSLRSNQDDGRAIPDGTRETMEYRLDADFSGVRVHTDSAANRLSQSLGANAFTTGSDIYFNENRYHPESQVGQELLAHELTHVAQQGGRSDGPIQCDLQESLIDTGMGGFEMNLAFVKAPSTPGMFGTIEFHPNPTGPYSTEIALIQTANVVDAGGVTTGGKKGAAMDWSNVGTGAEAPRNEVRTPLGGTFIDIPYATALQSSATGPEYAQPSYIAGNPAHQHHGWLRSPSDIKEASLQDYPSSTADVDFTFETAAKGTDNQVVYGAVHWGFEIRSGVAQNDYAYPVATESAEFDEALERFRGFYTHEPIVLYYDTDKDVPMTGELGKLADVKSYMSRYPDVRIQVDGYADETGPKNATVKANYNLDLSFRRADNAVMLLTGMGIDDSRIEIPIGRGQTTTFAPGSPVAAPGSLRANRRVVISFVRTASSLINP